MYVHRRDLVEKFDGSIGAGSVFMPFGGKYQIDRNTDYGGKVTCT
ncbi:MAG: hypothetical protein ACLUR5_10095 [Eubacterium ventriosum]